LFKLRFIKTQYSTDGIKKKALVDKKGFAAPTSLPNMILFHLGWVRPGDVRDGLAPTPVFNAVPSSAFSAPAELAPSPLNAARQFPAPLWPHHFVFAVIVAGQIASLALQVILKPTAFS